MAASCQYLRDVKVSLQYFSTLVELTEWEMSTRIMLQSDIFFAEGAFHSWKKKMLIHKLKPALSEYVYLH